MIKEKQMIEEMAHVICESRMANFADGCRVCSHHESCLYQDIACALYRDGYRKQSEREWVAKDNFDGRCSIASCSNCGTEKAFSILVRTETIAELYPYCQKCGAKMKGSAE